MSLSHKFDHVREYLGLRSKSYSHTPSPCCYDPDEPLAYYLDNTPKVNYTGPADDTGLPLVSYRNRLGYSPIEIAIFCLGHLESYRRNPTETCLMNFKNAAEWFVRNQDDSGSWLTYFPVRKFGILKPWPSAMAQGLAISCLTRAYGFLGIEKYLNTAIKALKTFHCRVEEGGVMSKYKGLVFYDEYPSAGGFHVLNGFIFALWGLLDLDRTVGHAEARELYESGLDTLLHILPEYDMGYWTLYCLTRGLINPASVPYHRLHVNQMKTMLAITGKQKFGQYHELWAGYMRNTLNRIRTLPRKILWNCVHGF